MPFKSAAQRRYLYANEPEIAKRWTVEEKRIRRKKRKKRIRREQ